MKLSTTEIVLGCRASDKTISRTDFEVIRTFANLPPLIKEPTILPDLVKYDVFPSQIRSPRLENGSYSVTVNLKSGVIDLNVLQHIKPTKELFLLHPPAKSGFTKLLYNVYEDKSEDVIFLLDTQNRSSQCFKNIEILRERMQYEYLCHSRKWYLQLESVHSYPQYEPHCTDAISFLHFIRPPRHRVRIWTNEIVPISSAMNAIRLMLPLCYHQNQTRWFR